MPLAQRIAAFRKPGARDGVVLAAKRTARLVDIPGLQDVTRHLREFALALKVPSEKDLDTQSLIQNIMALMCALGKCSSRLRNVKTVGGSVMYLKRVQRFERYLQNTLSELKKIQDASPTSKWLSQGRDCEFIMKRREEVTSMTLVLLTDLITFNLTTTSKNRASISRVRRRVYSSEASKKRPLVRPARGRLKRLENRVDELARVNKSMKRREKVYCLLAALYFDQSAGALMVTLARMHQL